jgi:pimeloyl-ACP methyl ester carboxylesterase
MPATAEVRTVAVGGQRLRVAIKKGPNGPGQPPRFPLLLILAGDDDPIVPLANARLMHRLIRDSRLHVYGGGHLGLLTEAAGLAPVVDGFLAAP